jgi:DNA-binding transcriptional MerR regulator
MADVEAPRRGRGRGRRPANADPGAAPRAASTAVAVEREAFPFTAPDRGAIWMRLSLNASQVAALCGVTLRQVIHWADRGYLPRASQDSGSFTGQAVDMCMLIKEARASGISHARAAEQARQFLANELQREGGSPRVGAPDLTTIAGRLREIEANAHGLLELIEPHIQKAEAE